MEKNHTDGSVKFQQIEKKILTEETRKKQAEKPNISNKEKKPLCNFEIRDRPNSYQLSLKAG